MDIVSEQDKINIHVARANYHAAINLAISAMNECRRNNDQNGVDIFLDVIKDIVHIMSNAFGSKPDNF